MIAVMARRTIAAGARTIVARRLDVQVDGLEHLPCDGAALIACRHVHHLYDGCLLLSALPRPLHLLVALDWVEGRPTRLLMEWACRTAQWPVVLRSERLQPPQNRRSAYQDAEVGHYLRRGVGDAVDLLRTGHALAVFPEAYPNIDPHGSVKDDDEAFLPFRPGFVRLAEMAQRDGRTQVPIIPAGLSYRRGARWGVTLRFAAPMFVAGRADRRRVARAVEDQVRALSAAPPDLLQTAWERMGCGTR